ncbi:hypothetical protein BGY98DRAFT_900153, partial [Russula aff. rugulosa BPL654]
VFRVALDVQVLPVQASAVSCERVFSSSKETCVLEVLQVLKHLHKEEHIDFTSYWIANECD